MNWKDKTTVKKGDFGEQIIKEHLISKGLIPYIPDFNGVHPFDFLCASPDKKNMVIVDAKAYARMNRREFGEYWTGINTRHYEEYFHLQQKYKVPVHLYFIDELEKRIYGNSLSELELSARIIHTKRGTKTIFRVSDMIHVASLSEEQVLELKRLSSRNYAYR